MKPEEALIYLYNGRMVGMFELGFCTDYGKSLTCASNCDYMTIVEVDESLFLAQTSVQAFSTTQYKPQPQLYRRQSICTEKN